MYFIVLANSENNSFLAMHLLQLQHRNGVSASDRAEMLIIIIITIIENTKSW